MVLFLQKKNFLLPCFFIPVLAFAHSRHFEETQRALHAARQRALLHHGEVAVARHSAAQEAAQAAVLAQAQVAAAANVRRLEDQTAQAAASLDGLAAQAQTAQHALQQNEAALAALLPVMQRLAREPAATMLAVPASAADAIRGVMVLQGVATEIARKAQAVHAQAMQVAALQAQTRAQQAALVQAVSAQQQAENALTAQIAGAQAAETSDLDTAARAAAAEARETQNVHDLQGVVARLQAVEQAQQAAARAPPPLPLPAPGTPAALPPAGAPLAGRPAPGAPLAGGPAPGAPVAGILVQEYGAPTVAGPAVGIVYKAAPGARVVSPCAGPVLYANPFQNYGLLVILDCGRNYDFVLSGMQHLDVTAGQQIARGQPVGQMTGYDAQAPTRQPTLYVELRQNGKPINPAIWLSGGGSG